MQSPLECHPDRLDTVFVINDRMMLGALAAINARGLDIPGDVYGGGYFAL